MISAYSTLIHNVDAMNILHGCEFLHFLESLNAYLTFADAITRAYGF